jgi:hypothetical protein
MSILSGMTGMNDNFPTIPKKIKWARSIFCGLQKATLNPLIVRQLQFILSAGRAEG